MSSQLSPLNRRPPFQDWISISIVQICILTFLLVQFDVADQGVPLSVATSRWGGMGSGIEIWNGEWWRIWTTAFHHADLGHLALNLWAFLFFARVLERRMGTFRYALFLFFAAGFSGVCQTLITPTWVGLSGVVCAQMGWIIGLRDRDDLLQARFSSSWVYSMVVILFLGFPLDWSGLSPIANVAHFAGMLYGLLIGLCTFRFHSLSLRTAGWVLSLGLLIPGVWTASHPYWNALYFWSLADHTQNDEQRIEFWKQALLRDPEIESLYQNLATLYNRRGETQTAWEILLQGLQKSPADFDNLQLARKLAQSPTLRLQSLLSPQDTRQQLHKLFGDQAPLWEKRLLSTDSFTLGAPQRHVRPADLPPTSSDEPQFWNLQPVDPTQKLPLPDPDTPESAAAGTRT